MKYILPMMVLVLSTALMPMPVYAGEVQQCGDPRAGDQYTDTAGRDFCDVHTRRIAYREQNKILRQRLEDRQKDYNAPRQQALENYKAAVEASQQGEQSR